ncbi:MAG: hypothetical protein JSV00_04885, partial [bacterium]
ASTSATVSAFAGNGTITWAGLSLGDVYRADGWLTGVLGAGNGAIELQTGNGDVSLGTVLKYSNFP